MIACYHRARLARLQGNLVLANTILTEKQDFPILKGDIDALVNLELGYLALENGNLARAGDLWREGIQILLEAKDMSWSLLFLEAMAVLATRERNLTRSTQLFCTRWSRGAYHTLAPSERAQRDAILVELKTTLGEAHFEQLYEEGQKMTLEQATALALENHE
jgi:hypothetical protein